MFGGEEKLMAEKILKKGDYLMEEHKFLVAIIKANGEIERRIITALTVCEANVEALKYGDKACVEAIVK